MLQLTVGSALDLLVGSAVIDEVVGEDGIQRGGREGQQREEEDGQEEGKRGGPHPVTEYREQSVASRTGGR